MDGHLGMFVSDRSQDRYDQGHARKVDTSGTGIRVGRVGGAASRGGETRPRNMAVSFIIRVF